MFGFSHGAFAGVVSRRHRGRPQPSPDVPIGPAREQLHCVELVYMYRDTHTQRHGFTSQSKKTTTHTQESAPVKSKRCITRA